MARNLRKRKLFAAHRAVIKSSVRRAASCLNLDGYKWGVLLVGRRTRIDSGFELNGPQKVDEG
jgi:hypothetical protein